jgi:hypothetical protein
MYVRNVGIGVGVGGTKEGSTVGPLGDGRTGAGVREPGEALGPTALGRHADTTIARSRRSATGRRRRSVMVPNCDGDPPAAVTAR